MAGGGKQEGRQAITTGGGQDYQQSDSHNYPVYHNSEHGYNGLQHILYPESYAGGHSASHSSYAGLDVVGPPVSYHRPEYQHQHTDHKAVALKGLLVPLAGVALLGAAAALISNPVLLQLGVITGRRRRRDASGDGGQQRLEDISLLEQFIAQVPKEQAQTHEKQLLATYLACGTAGYSNRSSLHCVERLACELYHPVSQASQLDRHVMVIVTNQILSNNFIPTPVKKRVQKAAETGSLSRDCSIFPCAELQD